MDRKVNVLIYPAGGENALEVKDALSYKVNIEVFGASSKKDHAAFAYKSCSHAPNVDEKNFLDEFNILLSDLKIDFVIPTHDTVALKLSELRAQLAGTLVASDFETNSICRHKRLTYELLRDEDFCPKVYRDASEVGEYPCFLKPDIGEGGKHSYVVEDREDLDFLLRKNLSREMVITEHLPGREFTIDCFTDRDRRLRYVGPRLRQRIFGGISVSAVTLKGKQFEEIAGEINSAVKFRGYWYFQLKEDKSGRLKLMELSARPAGTMSLYRQRGINFMLLSLYDFMGYDFEIIDNGYPVELDRALISRYDLGFEYDSIYMDFDDTLVFGGKPNKYCLMLLYQSKSRGIPVTLLTKHADDIGESLKRYGISKHLFHKITLLKMDEDKSKHISHRKPIFIDNSYRERAEIHSKLNIPVFDTDSVPSLLDWRE